MTAAGGASPRHRYVAAILATALLAFTLTLGFGLHGLGRPGLPQLDFLAYYGAGSLLLDHDTPYGFDPKTPPRMAAQGERNRVFAYPPNMGPVVVALSQGTYRQGRYWFNALNVLAVIAFGIGVALLAGASRLGNPRARAFRDAFDRRTLLVPSIMMLIAWSPPYASHALWFGNIEAMATALVVWAWWLEHRGYSKTSGLLIGLAAVKPPSVLLPGFWLLLERRWTTLVVAAAVVMLLATPMMLQFGVVGAWGDWLRGMLAYAATPENQPTGEGVIGLRSVLVSVGIASPDLKALGLLFTLLLWRFGRPLSPVTSLSLLAAGMLLFFDGHTPALIWLAVIAGGWLDVAGLNVRSLTIGAVALIAFLMPREVLRLVDAPDWVLRYRTVELLLLTGAMVYLIARRKRDTPAPLGDAKWRSDLAVQS
jgi:hypothetical protein